MADGKLDKLTIHVFDKRDNDGGVIDQENTDLKFVVQYNPTNYTRTYGVVLDSTIKDGDVGDENVTTESKVKAFKPDDVSFTFLLDATNASPSATLGSISPQLIDGDTLTQQSIDDNGNTTTTSIAKNIVTQQIEAFKGLTREVNEKTHDVPLLVLSWGTFLMTAICENVSIAHELFDPNGQPIRATVTAKFKQQTSNLDLTAYKKLFSPDLTKVRMIKSGETILDIANNEYGTPLLYTEIARTNNLTNFRRLQSGRSLVLPPIDKTN